MLYLSVLLTWFDRPSCLIVNSKCILKAFSSLLYTFDCVRETILASNVCSERPFCMANDFLPLVWVRVACAGNVVHVWCWQLGWGISSWCAMDARWVWGLGSPVPCIVGLENRVVVAEFLC
jgi:hypothetical protein